MSFDLTEVSRQTIDALGVVGPVACVASLAGLTALACTAAGRTRLMLAHRGLRQRAGGARRAWLAGTLLPLLATASLTAALSIEAEIRNGPNRMLSLMETTVPDEEAHSFWLLENGTDHFMNTSEVPISAADLEGAGITAAMPVWMELTTVVRANGSHQTGLVLAVGSSTSPPVRRGSTCEGAPGRCRLQRDQAIVDIGDGYQIDDVITIRGTRRQVVAYFQTPVSLLNRSVVMVAPDQATVPYGYVVIGTDRATLGTALEGVPGGDHVQILTSRQIHRENIKFWSGNGTPILTMLVMLIAIFGAAAIFATRRAEREATKEVSGTLRALGLTAHQATQIDLARSQISVLIPALPAAGLGALLVAFLNTSVLGFEPLVGLSTVLSSVGLMAIAASLAATVSARSVRHDAIASVV